MKARRRQGCADEEKKEVWWPTARRQRKPGIDVGVKGSVIPGNKIKTFICHRLPKDVRYLEAWDHGRHKSLNSRSHCGRVAGSTS